MLHKALLQRNPASEGMGNWTDDGLGHSDRKTARIPLLLFHGPPVTWKTMAMKLLAAQSELSPYILKTKAPRRALSPGPQAPGEEAPREMDHSGIIPGSIWDHVGHGCRESIAHKAFESMGGAKV